MVWIYLDKWLDQGHGLLRQALLVDTDNHLFKVLSIDHTLVNLLVVLLKLC